MMKLFGQSWIDSVEDSLLAEQGERPKSSAASKFGGDPETAFREAFEKELIRIYLKTSRSGAKPAFKRFFVNSLATLYKMEGVLDMYPAFKDNPVAAAKARLDSYLSGTMKWDEPSYVIYYTPPRTITDILAKEKPEEIPLINQSFSASGIRGDYFDTEKEAEERVAKYKKGVNNPQMISSRGGFRIHRIDTDTDRLIALNRATLSTEEQKALNVRLGMLEGAVNKLSDIKRDIGIDEADLSIPFTIENIQLHGKATTAKRIELKIKLIQKTIDFVRDTNPSPVELQAMLDKPEHKTILMSDPRTDTDFSSAQDVIDTMKSKPQQIESDVANLRKASISDGEEPIEINMAILPDRIVISGNGYDRSLTLDPKQKARTIMTVIELSAIDQDKKDKIGEWLNEANVKETADKVASIRIDRWPFVSNDPDTPEAMDIAYNFHVNKAAQMLAADVGAAKKVGGVETDKETDVEAGKEE